MHPRLQRAILVGALAALLMLVRTSAAHFVLIYPEADEDQPALTADAAWLRPLTKAGRVEGPSPKAKIAKPLPNAKKSDTRVTPLKRERPKSETDPPKTRRRQLGW